MLKKLLICLILSFTLCGCRNTEKAEPQKEIAILEWENKTIENYLYGKSEMTNYMYSIDIDGKPKLDEIYNLQLYKIGGELIDEYQIKFKDTTKPTIEQIDNVTINFNKLSGVKIEDNYDDPKDIEVMVRGVNVYEKGLYSGRIVAKDKQGNSASYECTIEVVEEIDNGYDYIWQETYVKPLD